VDWYYKENSSRGCCDVSSHREDTTYDEAWLRSLLSGLNHSVHPAVCIGNLSILGLQDNFNMELASTNDAIAVLSRLRSLMLRIATDNSYLANTPYLIEMPERYRVFSHDLEFFWLIPVKNQLSRLELSGNCFWGYIPKCDLRNLHFPKLTSLTLASTMFTHDWKLDWIISHSKRLESLTLLSCPIVYDAVVIYPLDSGCYPILDEDFSLPRYLSFDPNGGQAQPNSPTTWTYKARWHDYFAMLESSLPNLMHLCINQNPLSWKDASHSSLSAALDVRRYYVFRWNGTCSAQNQRFHNVSSFCVMLASESGRRFVIESLEFRLTCRRSDRSSFFSFFRSFVRGGTILLRSVVKPPTNACRASVVKDKVSLSTRCLCRERFCSALSGAWAVFTA
jgi:hypothetical protein